MEQTEIKKKGDEILRQVRDLIRDKAKDDAGKVDPDAWFKINRWVYARLQLDERRRKYKVKTNLFKKNPKCHYCGKTFDKIKGVELHRLDRSRGYYEDNCVLVHRECHQMEERLAKSG